MGFPYKRRKLYAVVKGGPIKGGYVVEVYCPSLDPMAYGSETWLLSESLIESHGHLRPGTILSVPGRRDQAVWRVRPERILSHGQNKRRRRQAILRANEWLALLVDSVHDGDGS